MTVVGDARPGLSGRYALGEPIGRGGMAIVYRAADRETGRPVALKVLREPYGHDPGAVRRFEWEARAAAALWHPNVVRVLDAGVQDGRRYLAMELVDGESLRAYLDRRGALAP